MPIVETVTDPTLAADVAAIAAATFPLACPPHSRPQDIEAFIAANLTATQFEAYIAHSDSEVFVVRSAPDGPIIGYSLVHHRPPADLGDLRRRLCDDGGDTGVGRRGGVD